MRTLMNLLILTLLFFSCDENRKSDSKIKSRDLSTEMNGDSSTKTTLSKEINTSTGRSYAIIENKKSASISDLNITPNGFPNFKETFRINEVNPLTQIFVQDLDDDGFEELYLITTGVGSGAYGMIHGYASNNDKSVSPIYIPEITEKDLLPKNNFYGYMGHDSIYVSNKTLLRKFPIYLKDDENCCPTGGIKIIEYKLTKGEASWRLEIKN